MVVFRFVFLAARTCLFCEGFFFFFSEPMFGYLNIPSSIFIFFPHHMETYLTFTEVFPALFVMFSTKFVVHLASLLA